MRTVIRGSPDSNRRTAEGRENSVDGLGVVGLTDEVQLAFTELVSNVIRHVGEGAAATLVMDSEGERLRIELHDKSFAVPITSSPEREAVCSRGLHLLAAMITDWGTAITATGKAVWCEFSVEAAQPCRRIRRGGAILESHSRQAGVPVMALPGGAPVLQDAVTNLIADLLHWLTAQGGDPDDFLDRAQMHYEAEPEAA
ncbi:ATP-binding protein [Streptomyces inhibens]|uniref:ATP-binding protein n=1 Tax=Streptomyces inhibens TaxID=2293571 RepID=UPI001EE7244F|nr:ATP-binding protein [Streptomyces inhibens]UKY51134.1 ATP-binding protein [Streptomyces inhibens]